MGSFVADFVAGKVKPSIKSEPIPASQGPVHVIVADSFEQDLADQSKDYFVECECSTLVAFIKTKFMVSLRSMVWSLQEAGPYLGNSW